MLGLACPGARAQYYAWDTDDVRLVYVAKIQEYLVPQVIRSAHNALEFDRKLFNYVPSEPVGLLVHDLWHYGNAGARPVPHNHITIGIAPYAKLYDTSPGNERLNSSMNHEMAHLVTTDKATRSDRVLRALFGGKVNPVAEQPVSMLFGYLTTPRWYTPRWYLEGIAVYLETWMNGGLGRALGAYDEMVFRTRVRDDAYLYDIVGLESEGTTIDFQVGVNSYLYGTRFVSYLAYRYGNEKLLQWYDRDAGSKRYFAAQFRKVYGKTLRSGWQEWLEWERGWQNENLDRIREQPITPHRDLSERALGSVSRAYLDDDGRTLYVAVRYPGQVAHLATLDLESGEFKRLHEVLGPSGFTVTATAYDPSTGTLFYTTDNRYWRHLVALDVHTGKTRTLLRDFRTGDLAFNPSDRSLWGVRHFNGLSTIVRIPYPYTEWNQVFSLPYGTDVYDLDIAPDGSALVASSSGISGKQQLVRMDLERLLEGDAEMDVLFDFGKWSPANFVFDREGAYLFGTSYYTGVSNVYRYDVAAGVMEPLSNTETGFFRPVPVSDDSLLAFRFTGEGFVPSMLPARTPPALSAVRLLGNEIVREQPDVGSWKAPSPLRFDIDSLTTHVGGYSPLRHLKRDAFYPIVEGYKHTAAVGVRMTLSDQLLFGRLAMRVSYSPDRSLGSDERIHAGISFDYLNLGIEASYNRADFYDLFGPTLTGRKGYSLRLRYRHYLVFDEPRTLAYNVSVAGYSGLETLPDFQNVATSFDKFLTARGGLEYAFLRKSLGAVEDELGVQARLSVRGHVVRGVLYPNVQAEGAVGFLLPIRHSSVWLRAGTGQSLAADRNSPFAGFYFGGFGNNWVDYGATRRYRDLESFPGIGIDDAGGSNFGKAQVEWVLPPIRFRRVGLPSIYLRWASLSLFASGLVTNIDEASSRRRLAGVGGQIDFRIVTLSHLKSTLSLGCAAAFEPDENVRRELMVSFRIL